MRATPAPGPSSEWLLNRASECRFCQQDLRGLESHLPEDEDVIDQLLSEAVRQRDAAAFTHVLLAALDLGRRVDARHLADGAVLLPDPGLIGTVVMRCTGDPAAALVEAVRRGGMGNEREATALLFAGKWYKERSEGAVPRELTARARILSRQAAGNPIAWLQLRALADLIEDEDLRAALEGETTDTLWTLSRELPENLLKCADDPVFALVPEEPQPFAASGYTVRRAVPRVGRNDPCPCGSGKKYKKCCIDEDQERLSHSSEVPGVTVEELRRSPESHLTVQRVMGMRSYELARLDPSRVSQDLHHVLVQRLLLYGESEAVVKIFETLGLGIHLDDGWWEAVHQVTHESQRDLLARLVAVREESGLAVEELDLGSRLLLEEDALAQLKMIEAQALEALKKDHVFELVDMAYDLLHSRTPALGILVARGVLPICGLYEAFMLLEELLTVRDELYLAPGDPLSETLDHLLNEFGDDSEESEGSKKTRLRLESKRAEVSSLKQQLAKVQAALEQSERPPAREPKPTVPRAEAADQTVEPAVSELRSRLESLKTTLKQRHLERNQLRRELRAAREDLATLRSGGAESTASRRELQEKEDNDETSMLQEEMFLGSQPPRTPRYPKKFQESLEAVPDPVAREAVRLIGRLAAGDAAAFRGTKRLKLRHEILRQRVGQRHRILFRMDEEALEVLALIHRHDLERTIKRLK